MQNEKESSVFLVITGIIILGAFTLISMINIVNRNEYQLSTDVVEDIVYQDGKLVVTTKKSMTKVCIKETKTAPKDDSLCWKETNNREIITSIYENKTYHIWIKDIDNVINYYGEYNTNNE